MKWKSVGDLIVPRTLAPPNQNLQNHTGFFLSCLSIGKRGSLSTVRPDLDQSVVAPPGAPPLPDLPIGYTPVLSWSPSLLSPNPLPLPARPRLPLRAMAVGRQCWTFSPLRTWEGWCRRWKRKTTPEARCLSGSSGSGVSGKRNGRERRRRWVLGTT